MVRNQPAFTALGRCASDISMAAAVVNEAQETLITDPMAPEEGWWGGHAEMVFNVQVNNLTGKIYTPRDIARVIVLDICQRPRHIRNGFYEYLSFGTGKQPRGCNPWCNQIQAAFDRDTVATMADFPTSPQLIRAFYSNSADVGKRVVVQGPDQNGFEVLGVDATTAQAVKGETIMLQNPFATTQNQFSQVTGMLKDQTLGPVTIFAIDPVSHVQTQIARMAPNETTAAYRLYFLNGLPANCCNTPTGLVQVTAQCKLDFVPVQSDQDYLTIQSVPAIIEECQSRRYSRMDAETAPGLEAKHHKKALSLLFGQLDHFLGKTRTAVSCKIFGSAKLRPQPI